MPRLIARARPTASSNEMWATCGNSCRRRSRSWRQHSARYRSSRPCPLLLFYFLPHRAFAFCDRRAPPPPPPPPQRSLAQERDRRKDQLLDLQRSKEERLEREAAGSKRAVAQANEAYARLEAELRQVQNKLARADTELRFFREARCAGRATNDESQGRAPPCAASQAPRSRPRQPRSDSRKSEAAVLRDSLSAMTAGLRDRVSVLLSPERPGAATDAYGRALQVEGHAAPHHAETHARQPLPTAGRADGARERGPVHAAQHPARAPAAAWPSGASPGSEPRFSDHGTPVRDRPSLLPAATPATPAPRSEQRPQPIMSTPGRPFSVSRAPRLFQPGAEKEKSSASGASNARALEDEVEAVLAATSDLLERKRDDTRRDAGAPRGADTASTSGRGSQGHGSGAQGPLRSGPGTPSRDWSGDARGPGDGSPGTTSRADDLIARLQDRVAALRS